MQHATFPGSHTTRGTSDRHYLFWLEFLLFHSKHPILRHAAKNCPILNTADRSILITRTVRLLPLGFSVPLEVCTSIGQARLYQR